MVGGGRNAFIGAVHRMAMRLDDLIELESRRLVFGRGKRAPLGRRSRSGARPDATPTIAKWRRREAARPDGIEAVVIVTPNHLHFPVAKAFLEAGIDVICDKPLSTTLAEASELVELTRAKGLIFAVTLNNTGYPMVRQAREMIEAGELGDIRVVHAAYVQDWLTLPIDADGHKQAEWRTDPARAGASACLADIGVHAHSLAAVRDRSRIGRGLGGPHDVRAGPPARRQRARADAVSGGARGVLAASQVAVGNLNNLSIKVYGSRGRPRMGGRRRRKRSASRPMASRRASFGAAVRETPRLPSKAPACRAAIPKVMSKASPISTAARPN